MENEGEPKPRKGSVRQPPKRQSPHSEAKESIFLALNGEHDRGCVLVGSAYLDYLVGLLLREWLLDAPPDPNKELSEKVLNPLDNRAFLFSGWSKSVVARLIGLLREDEYQIIEKIRTLRNEFAHSPTVVLLDDEKVNPLVALLPEYRRNDPETMWTAEGETEAKRLWTEAYPGFGFSKSRINFMSVCIYVYLGLLESLDAYDAIPQQLGVHRHSGGGFFHRHEPSIDQD